MGRLCRLAVPNLKGQVSHQLVILFHYDLPEKHLSPLTEHVEVELRKHWRERKRDRERDRERDRDRERETERETEIDTREEGMRKRTAMRD